MMTEPRQIEIARSLIGTHEGDNPVITGFARKIGELYPEMKAYAANYTSDGIAWCGLFVAYCMAMSGMRPVFGASDTDRFLWAQSWKQFGTATSAPQIGDVLVLAHHVTMYVGTRDGRYIGLGGNQSDSVKESPYSPDSVEAIRRPPIAGTVTADQHPEIKIGATGGPVIELQRLLHVLVTGDFDAATDGAVRAFQAASGLDVDGEVGPLTWAALLAAPVVTADKVQTSKGSWYSQLDGKYRWRDPGDRPDSAALGVPDDAQGIARPQSFGTLGTWFAVRAPNGKVSLEIQSDHGPAAWTGRTLDISAAAAERFGYSPDNFPTDGIFTFWPVAAPPEVASLSPPQQAVRYRDLRNTLPPPPIVIQPPPVPDPEGNTMDDKLKLVLITEICKPSPDVKALQLLLLNQPVIPGVPPPVVPPVVAPSTSGLGQNLLYGLGGSLISILLGMNGNIGMPFGADMTSTGLFSSILPLITGLFGLNVPAVNVVTNLIKSKS